MAVSYKVMQKHRKLEEFTNQDAEDTEDEEE